MNYFGIDTLCQTNQKMKYIKKEIIILREELKSKDFIIKGLLQTIKEIKTKSVSV